MGGRCDYIWLGISHVNTACSSLDGTYRAHLMLKPKDSCHQRETERGKFLDCYHVSILSCHLPWCVLTTLNPDIRAQAQDIGREDVNRYWCRDWKRHQYDTGYVWDLFVFELGVFWEPESSM